MKTNLIYIFFLSIILSSCTTTYNTYHTYSDPNYLESGEFNEVDISKKKR